MRDRIDDELQSISSTQVFLNGAKEEIRCSVSDFATRQARVCGKAFAKSAQPVVRCHLIIPSELELGRLYTCREVMPATLDAHVLDVDAGLCSAAECAYRTSDYDIEGSDGLFLLC